MGTVGKDWLSSCWNDMPEILTVVDFDSEADTFRFILTLRKNMERLARHYLHNVCTVHERFKQFSKRLIGIILTIKISVRSMKTCFLYFPIIHRCLLNQTKDRKKKIKLQPLPPRKAKPKLMANWIGVPDQQAAPFANQLEVASLSNDSLEFTIFASSEPIQGK